MICSFISKSYFFFLSQSSKYLPFAIKVLLNAHIIYLCASMYFSIFFICLLENNGMSSNPPILKSTREDEQRTVGYPIETSKSKEEFCTEVVTNLFTFI